jgi:hypothetical protein
MKTLLLKGSTTVKARSFLYNKPITETSTASFEKVIPSPALAIADVSSAGLDYFVYEGEWSKLPDFDSLTPTASGASKSIDIGSKQGSDNYGFVLTASLKSLLMGFIHFIFPRMMEVNYLLTIKY